MKNILKKLGSSRGETLVESLASILIFTLASILFLTMVNSAARINEAAKKEDDAFQSRQQTMEVLPANPSEDDSRTVTIIKGDRPIGECKVYVVDTGDDNSDCVFYPHYAGEGENP